MVSTDIVLRPYLVRVTIRLAVPADDATIIDIGGPDADDLATRIRQLLKDNQWHEHPPIADTAGHLRCEPA